MKNLAKNMDIGKNQDKFVAKSGRIRYGYIAAFVSSALYGSISTITKPIIADTNPIMIAVLVGLFCSIIFAIPAIREKEKISKSSLPLVVAISILGAVLAPLSYFFGLESTSASNATTLSNAEIAFTVILALFIFKENIGRYGLISIVLVFSGVYLVTTNFANPLEFDPSHVGDYMILATMFFWAFDNNLSKIVLQKISVKKLVFFRSFIGGGILSVVVVVTGSFNVTVSSIPNIILLSIVGFAIPMFLFYVAIHIIGTIKTILIFSTSPVFGIFLANVFLGEELQVTRFSAVAIMIIGIILLYKEKIKTSTDINVQGPK